MTKTTNHQLPQWEAHDPIRRADFNDAMKTIDTALAGKADETALTALYSDTNKPYQLRTAYISSAFPLGTTIFTFPFEPAFVILVGGSTALVTTKNSAQSSASVATSRTNASDANGDLTFSFSGNAITLTARGSSAVSAYVYAVAFR